MKSPFKKEAQTRIQPTEHKDLPVHENKTVEESREELAEDRSAFNCGTCGGDGLIEVRNSTGENVLRQEICASCAGTGKI